MTMKSLFVERRHRQVYFDVAVFPLSSLVTGPSSCLYHYWFWSYDSYFVRDWQEIQKSDMQLSDFCLIYVEWGLIFLLKSHLMLPGLQLLLFLSY